jgi:ribose transport system substrate-binding protein
MKRSGSEARVTRPSYKVTSVARACDILACFTSSSEVLELRTVAERSRLNKVTVFRILETLVEKSLLERLGKNGYRSRIQPVHTKRFRIGYASQSAVVPFTATVTDTLLVAAKGADVDLLVLNNRFSSSMALKNAERFIAEKMDLVIESQIEAKVASRLSSRFSDARIPVIAVDIPHPGAIYFGADNYKAGRLAGNYLGKWASRNWQGRVNQIVFAEVAAAGPALNVRLSGMWDGMIEALSHLRSVPVFHYDTKGQFERTLELMRKHLRLHKADRVLIGAVNDTSALAALQGFRELGAEEKCAVAGQDACLEARQEMRRPSSRLVCSAAYFPEQYGERLIRLALDILNGKPVPPAIFTHHELVTADNVNKIYPNDSWLNASAVRKWQ